MQRIFTRKDFVPPCYMQRNECAISYAFIFVEKDSLQSVFDAFVGLLDLINICFTYC